MITTMSRKAERNVQRLARLAGGEAALQRALHGFRREHRRDPDARELLRYVVEQRIADLKSRNELPR